MAESVPLVPLRDLVQILGADKATFLSAVKIDITIFVACQRDLCLAIVERDVNSPTINRTVGLAASREYASLLMKLCRGEHNNGRQLDSFLTDPIVMLVNSSYKGFYESKSEQLAQAFTTALIENPIVLNGFVTVLTDIIAREAGKHIREQMITLIIHQLKEAATSEAGRAISTAIQHSTTATTAMVVAHTVAILITKLMATQFKFVVIKVLSMAATQKLILIAVKKFVAATVVASIAKFMSVHLGISVHASITIVLVPLIAALIIREVDHFPEQLGEKIAGEVHQVLDDKFDTVNENIVNKMFDEIINTNSEDLIGTIAENKDVRDMMINLMKELERSPA